ncbi:MAG: phosphomannomutase/phosphoglucomutase [Anaerolineae bacterium]|nr:phosphomannomutase/phosphoglucomutase [Anaerolineae bacterium]
MVKANIFRTYDIRGKAGVDIDADTAYQVARAFASYLIKERNTHRVVVGYDLRPTSAGMADALCRGFVESGCHVLNIGLVATPVLYHQAARLDAGGVMVTASHLTKEYNGIKLTVGREALYGDTIKAMHRRVEAQDFVDGSGARQDIDDVNQVYITQLVGGFWPAGRRLKIVVDAGNGMGGPYGPQLLTMMGHEVIAQFCELDSDFPNHHPNPEKAANMRDLQAKVLEVGADLGVAFDGDADRVGVVDEKGQLISADRLLAWLIKPVVARYPGAAVVADVLSSQVLFDVVRSAGGRPVMWQSGYARVRAKMRAEAALLGGESSGHMFFGDRYFGFDDGIYAAGRVAEMLSLTGGALSEQIAALPQMYLTPEYRPYCPDAKKAPIIAAVKEAFAAKYPVVDVDGVRVLFEDGWGLLRASGTEEVLSLRFEAYSEAAAHSYKAQVVEALRRVYPELEEL